MVQPSSILHIRPITEPVKLRCSKAEEASSGCWNLSGVCGPYSLEMDEAIFHSLQPQIGSTVSTQVWPASVNALSLPNLIGDLGFVEYLLDLEPAKIKPEEGPFALLPQQIYYDLYDIIFHHIFVNFPLLYIAKITQLKQTKTKFPKNLRNSYKDGITPDCSIFYFKLREKLLYLNCRILS